MITTKTSKQGFTLIELMVTVSIITLIASIVLASLGSVRARARDAKISEEIDGIQTALQAYAIDHGGYPNPGSGLYCIGNTDCVLAGVSVPTEFPQGISWLSPSDRLASIFPVFTAGSIELDPNNKGYIYLSCDSSAETCPIDEAALIYPRFNDNSMVSMLVGSFTEETYVATVTYDQSSYPYCFSSDTSEGCSLGNGWCGDGYYYCASTVYTSCNSGSGTSYSGTGPEGSCTYYNPSYSETYYDSASYPYYYSSDPGNGCSYGNGWAGNGYYYCSTDGNSYSYYYDNQSSCNQSYISTSDYNNYPSRYFSDYSACSSSLYSYYYDNQNSCTSQYISISEYTNNPSRYYTDYTSCQNSIESYSYYYDNQNSCSQSYISSSEYNNNPSRYYSDYTSCQNSLETYSYYYDSYYSCNQTYISSSEYNSNSSRYYSDYMTCTSGSTYYDSSSYPYCNSYDSGGSCSYGNGWCGSGYYYCQYY